jgi:DNA-binding transcriptional LysR family regulator
MDRLQELAVLVAVIDHGSLAAASRRLRQSPPAVTRALAALEDRVGVRLVERTTRRLSATEAGRAFAERARALLNEYDSAVTGLAEAPLRGILRVTAPFPFGRRHVTPLVIGLPSNKTSICGTSSDGPSSRALADCARSDRTGIATPSIFERRNL